MIITRKVELKVIGTEEEKKKSHKLLMYYHNTIARLNNFIVTEIFLNDLLKEKLSVHTENYKEKRNKFEETISSVFDEIEKNNLEIKNVKKIEDAEKREKTLKKLETKKVKLDKQLEDAKKKRNKFIGDTKKEIQDQFKAAFGKGLDSSINERIRAVEEFKELPDTIVSPAIAELGFYKKNLYKIKMGEERIRMYSKGMPFNTRGRDIKLIEYGKDLNINWVNKIRFKIHFGVDKSNNRSIFDKIYKDEYKICDSKIQYNKKKNKFFLLACVDIPKNDTKEVKEGRVLGVDLGIKYPAYMSLNDRPYIRSSYGSYEDFFKVRTQMNSRRQRLQKALETTKGGRGRKSKLKALEAFNKKERNWARTYNHSISRKIINFALEHKCEQINIESLTKQGFASDSTILRNWSFYELMELIRYKAESEGIKVETVNPAYTSQRCSECGHISRENRETQERFICKECGFEENADYNASRNIAMYDEWKSDQEQLIKNK